MTTIQIFFSVLLATTSIFLGLLGLWNELFFPIYALCLLLGSLLLGISFAGAIWESTSRESLLRGEKIASRSGRDWE